MTINPATTAGTDIAFNITGGGTIFQVGRPWAPREQARLGIQSIATRQLSGRTATARWNLDALVPTAPLPWLPIRRCGRHRQPRPPAR